MNIKKIATGLLAALALSWTPVVYAVDNETEFGIEDDLSVFGREGTAPDPDAEIKGFTVFGSTQAAYTGAVVGAGNVVVNGVLAVSSGAYFVDKSTFAGGAYFTAVSSFSNVANIHIAGGTANQVLKKVAGGGMVWADDSLGAGEITGTPRRLVMYEGDGTGGADSLLQQDAGDTSITSVGSSSMTILGAFQTNGAAKFNGAVTLGDAAGDAIQVNGNATAAGTLLVNGNVDLDDKLNVDGASTFVSSVTARSAVQIGDAYTDAHAVNMAPSADTGLSIAGQQVAGDYVVKLYSGTLLSAWLRKK
ncbi:MAG TPA: hypothetical protein DCZ93_02860 [Elusimicrobia bacterium]|nr:hypothetical protein [Elusimicrobiota bacterium]